MSGQQGDFEFFTPAGAEKAKENEAYMSATFSLIQLNNAFNNKNQ